jgi:hypothetical protein
MLLKDQALQKRLSEKGYITLPFLNEEEVKQLNTLYDSVHGGNEPPDFIDNIHMTSWCSDFAYKQKISNGLTRLFDEPSSRFFKDYRRLNHVFIIKRSGQQTTFKVHQDWNVIDETTYESVNVWVPLHDVNESSGALWVLEGSHRINRNVRGAGYLFPDYGAHMDTLEKKAVSVKLKAGEAIVFYHSVIHGSPPNLSQQLRRAACFSVVPVNAPLCIYYQPTAQAPLEQYEPADDFIFRYNHLRTETLQRPPAETPVKIMAPYQNKKVTEEDLMQFLKVKTGLFSFFNR